MDFINQNKNASSERILPHNEFQEPSVACPFFVHSTFMLREQELAFVTWCWHGR